MKTPATVFGCHCPLVIRGLTLRAEDQASTVRYSVVTHPARHKPRSTGPHRPPSEEGYIRQSSHKCKVCFGWVNRKWRGAYLWRSSFWSPRPVRRERDRVRALCVIVESDRPSPRPSPRVPGEGNRARPATISVSPAGGFQTFGPLNSIEGSIPAALSFNFL